MKTGIVVYNPGSYDAAIKGESPAIVVGEGTALINDAGLTTEKKTPTKNLLVFTESGTVVRNSVPHADSKIAGNGKDEEDKQEVHAYWTESE